MAGNTRGKLKEHFEGIHRNFDWSLHHINSSLKLLAVKLRETPDVKALNGDEEKIQAYIQKYPLYAGILALGAGISKLDELAGDVYKSL